MQVIFISSRFLHIMPLGRLLDVNNRRSSETILTPPSERIRLVKGVTFYILFAPANGDLTSIIVLVIYYKFVL